MTSTADTDDAGGGRAEWAVDLRPLPWRVPAGARPFPRPPHRPAEVEVDRNAVGSGETSPAPPRLVERSAPAASAPSAGGATLTAKAVSCWFGERKVLEDVSLTMPPGQITALIGPSGCGKSTFLRALNRMHERVPGASLAGEIALDGVDIYGAGSERTRTRLAIGMVFQRPNPFPAMTIAQNVLAGLRLSGMGVRNADEVLETSLRRAGLWNEAKDRLDTSGAALSGGQQQRLCIARALAVNPRVLLMDEPCSALDPISTGVIEDTMIAVRDQVTIVIVTHNMQQASRVSDQCALFLVDYENAPGRIVEVDATAEVFANPRDPRTQDYVAGRFG